MPALSICSPEGNILVIEPATVFRQTIVLCIPCIGTILHTFGTIYKAQVAAAEYVAIALFDAFLRAHFAAADAHIGGTEHKALALQVHGSDLFLRIELGSVSTPVVNTAAAAEDIAQHLALVEIDLGRAGLEDLHVNTVDTYTKQLTGELFTRWYEAWITGGCVEDEQGKGISGQEGHWQITSGKQMEQNWEDPNVFEWTGLLKAYSYNQEPKRFKINGQYGWSPKVLHPFTQDASILTASQVWYNGSEDYKWAINKDGYYHIKINVFEETIEGEYLGAELPDGINSPFVETRDGAAYIYNLAGQRLSKPQPGLNIIGGRKVLIK